VTDKYWLCCGSEDESHDDESCMAGWTNNLHRRRYGTEDDHRAWQLARTKPPLGLMPENIHRQLRALDILAAMKRYVESDKPIPEEWFTELQSKRGTT
jgi:hypothetical protein